MRWIAVYEDVLSGKLRGFRKYIKKSDTEALGILVVLWLWATKNADDNGVLKNTDINDIVDAMYPYLSSETAAEDVAAGLIETGFIDDNDGTLSIHDWNQWHGVVLREESRLERDRNRKREARLKAEKETEEKTEQIMMPELKEEPVAKKKTKKEKPPKHQYSELVFMYESQYDKLVEKYGKPFTEKLIERLDAYKGNGKKYTDDYRAILSWVIDDCKQKYPSLIAKKPQPSSGSNPFADFM